jgi:hypothetical protein
MTDTQKLSVKTSWHDGGIIDQTFYSEVDGVRSQIMRQVMDTGEAQVRDALIALGWSPPQK